MIEADVVAADEEDLVGTVEVVEEAVEDSAATEEDEAAALVAVEVHEVDSVTGVVAEADEVLPVDVDVEHLEVVHEAVLVAARQVVPEVDPTLSSSPIVTPVSLLLKARRCSSSPRTLPLASPFTARSESRSRLQELVQMEQAPRPNTESGTLSDQSWPLVSLAVWI